MDISSDTIRDMAQLARLRVDDSELPDITRRFGAILDMFEDLSAVDVSGVEPLTNPLDATQPLRLDEVTETDQRDTLQSSAPLLEDGLYLVPRVVE
ncbi:MAG: Asp-tRNA(Asn)/Glu-tRNA(Gln) amidotransferase subunit GatC [Pseudomonadota bacterium]